MLTNAQPSESKAEIILYVLAYTKKICFSPCRLAYAYDVELSEDSLQDYLRRVP